MNDAREGGHGNFDVTIERRGTGSLKWDGMRGYFGVEGDDVLPMWVADMDFPSPDAVIDALVRRARHGVFGYASAAPSYFSAMREWMRRRHGWDVKDEWFVSTPGVVCAVNLLIRTLTNRGDGVIIQPPVYHPFRRGIEDNGCRVLFNRLLFDGARYRMDLADLERKLPEAKMLILCSPHNPVGRVWTREELQALADLCLRYGVIVVSDEIHFDLIFASHTHTVFATLSEELAQQSVVCTSPSKTFNLPGLQPAITVIPSPRIRRDFARTVRACGIPGPHAFCLEAVTAAYSHGEAWLDELLAYLEGNVAFVDQFVAREIPRVRLVKPEATFLAWLDCRALELEPARIQQLLLSVGRLALNQGYTFGPGGEGFIRISYAADIERLKEGVARLSAWASSTSP